MKKYLPNLKSTLILTPGIFLLTLWIMIFSSSGILEAQGLFKLTLWALIVAFGAAYSITLFVHQMLKRDA